MALLLRRIPIESGRWRIIPPTLERCKHDVVAPTRHTVKTRSGFRMLVDVSEWFGRHIYVTGEYEPATTKIIRSCLKPGNVFVDVGANAGYFTLLAAKQVGSSGKVLTFEPVPKLRAQLEANLRLNGLSNCCIFDTAVSNVEGKCEFFVGPVNHQGLSSLRCLDDASERLVVRLVRLDTLLQNERRVDVVKIDVEGAECHVLEGMTEILKRSMPNVVVEVTANYLAAMQRSPNDLHRIMRQLGYESYAIEDSGLRPLDDFMTYGEGQFNAFFAMPRLLPPMIPILEH